jgi:hypothetical protein
MIPFLITTPLPQKKKLSHSSNYYAKGKGLVESSTKNLLRIIKKQLGVTKEARTTGSSLHSRPIES